MRTGNFSVLISEGLERESGHVIIDHGNNYKLKLMSHTTVRSDAEVTIDGKTIGIFRLAPYEQILVDGPPDDPQHGKFTFYATDSKEGDAIGASGINKDDRGTVVVRFKPELPYVPSPRPVEPAGFSKKRTNYEYYGFRDDGCALLRSAGPKWHDEVGGSTTPTSYDEPGVSAGSKTTTTCSSNDSEVTARTIQTCNLSGLTSGATGISGYTDQRWHDVAPLNYDVRNEVVITIRLVTDRTRSVKDPRPLLAVKSNPVPAAVG